jgi:hypothetical protein
VLWLAPTGGKAERPERAVCGLLNRDNLAVTKQLFLIKKAVADAARSNATLLVSIIGLIKMKPWGWVPAFMATTIWLYTMTFALVRDLHTEITLGTLFLLPFAAFAVFSTVYLWIRRDLFRSERRRRDRR